MAFSPDTAIDFLRRARQSGRLAHAYLITGEAGSGKRHLALSLAAEVNGLGANVEKALQLPDVHTVEPESKSRLIRVSQMRDLERALQMRSSTAGGLKVGIIMDAERMNIAAANSFLKTLEEPPAHSLLVLVTAHPEMLLDTILSRCINVPLTPPLDRTLSPAQEQLLDLLDRYCALEKVGLPEVFNLVREFSALLSESKTEAQDEGASELKKEEALYKQTTDGKWLEEREDHFKALAESRYQLARKVYVEMLLQWWGDVLRLQHGNEALDFPTRRERTSALAARYSVPEVLEKVTALEGLRENFNRNVQEQLAIEVAFLKAFGGKR